MPVVGPQAVRESALGREDRPWRDADALRERLAVASGIRLPSGFWKPVISQQALGRWRRIARASASSSMPSLGWVGTSIASSPLRSSACSAA
jgi:hypothetical protein